MNEDSIYKMTYIGIEIRAIKAVSQSNINKKKIDPNSTIIDGKKDGIISVMKLFIDLVSSIILLNSSPLLFLSKKDVFNLKI